MSTSTPPLHLDDIGNPCKVHEPANLDALMTLAVIGSRVASFNHDIASKLQGLMMALDEMSELVEHSSDPDLKRAAETANASLKETSAMLSANRALTRTATRTKSTLPDLIKAASERAGVAIRGPISDGEIEAVIPLLAHGLACALDAIAGSGRNRSLGVSSSVAGNRITMIFATTEAPAKAAGDLLALGAFVVSRTGGELRCTPAGLEIQLPLV